MDHAHIITSFWRSVMHTHLLFGSCALFARHLRVAGIGSAEAAVTVYFRVVIHCTKLGVNFSTGDFWPNEGRRGIKRACVRVPRGDQASPTQPATHSTARESVSFDLIGH